MALTTQRKQQLRAEFGRVLSEGRTPFNLSRPDLDAAISAIDNWIEANAAAFNTAIPQPARGVLTSGQKMQLFYLVAQARYGG